VYSCSGSERKELLARLGWREVAQALDDPAPVVALPKFRQRAPQFAGGGPLAGRHEAGGCPSFDGFRVNRHAKKHAAPRAARPLILGGQIRPSKKIAPQFLPGAPGSAVAFTFQPSTVDC